MTNCDDIIDGFRTIEAEQRLLAEVIEVQPVADMHRDISDFAGEQAIFVEEICED